MTLQELKKSITEHSMPSKMVWVDENHTLVEYYLNQLSRILNRRVKKIFSQDEAITIPEMDGDSDYILYVLYLPEKIISQTLELCGNYLYIAIVEEEIKDIRAPQITFGKLSRNADIVFIENQVKIPKKTKSPKEEPEYYLSRKLIEELIDYFDGDLDLCMNEINKIKALELTSSWDHAFKALLNCLPDKQKRLKSLNWFSGGDVDTCQVLYKMYIKKLRELPMESKEKQELWARLVKESVWCEAAIINGLVGDYVLDYLRLVESSFPKDFEIQYFPPVFHSELEKFPEWNKLQEEN